MKKIKLLFIIGLDFWGCEECDDSLTNELMKFADDNWSLEAWVNNRFNPPTNLIKHRNLGNYLAQYCLPFT